MVIRKFKNSFLNLYESDKVTFYFILPWFGLTHCLIVRLGLSDVYKGLAGPGLAILPGFSVNLFADFVAFF